MWREGLKDGESGIGGGEMAKATAVGKIGSGIEVSLCSWTGGTHYKQSQLNKKLSLSSKYVVLL